MEEITPAVLSKDDEGNIYAVDFKDYYCSKLNALEESRYVFLQGNQLPERWHHKKNFVITELGFGTGLNFLTTWLEWLKNTRSEARLHYIAIEKHPLQPAELRALLAHWPELAVYRDELLANYPPLLAGMHRLELAGGRINLTLCFMDVSTALDELVAAVDCWYPDGFAPAVNPAMWSEQRMRQLAVLSKPGATLATFTAAGAVRRNLQAAGFTVAKRKGFGRKREMLTAVYAGGGSSNPSALQPWYKLPAVSPVSRSAIVIGGGIAGCQTARALAERGWQVRLLERHDTLAQEASGNRAGVLIPKMTAEPGWGERFYRQAFLYAHRQLSRLQREHSDLEWSACGSIQLHHNARESKRAQALSERQLPESFIRLLDAEQAAQVAGIELPYGGSYFPQGGWINPRSLCQVLVRHENIVVLKDTAALTLQQLEQQWQVNSAEDGLLIADVVVIANGKDVRQFTETAQLPFMPVAGQTSSAGTFEGISGLKTTLGHEGYLTPVIDGQYIFGATFERGEDNVSLSAQADQQNLQQLSRYLPELAAQSGAICSGHAAVRMTTPDRFPYLGAVADTEYYRVAYADLRHGKLNQFYSDAEYLPGLYIAAGYGSRGLTTSGLCAAVLAGLINREPLAIEKSLYYQLHPARFLIKRIKQNRD